MAHLTTQFDDPSQSLAFNTLWFDEMAATDRAYRLFFYAVDNTVELIDLRSGKRYLKRT